MLRPYQANCLEKIKTKYQLGVKNQLVKMATGLGKTVIIANLNNVLQWKTKVLVLVHRDELARQTAEKIKHWNPDASVSIEMGDYTSYNTDWVVGGIQSVSKDNRLLKFNPSEYGIVIVDEAHHAVSPSYKKVLGYFRNGNLSSLRLGLTATPNRADGKGLGLVFDEIIEDYDIIKGIKDGWLVDLVGRQIRTTTNLDAVKSNYGDFNVSDLDKIANTPTRNLEIVNGWKRFAESRQTVFYAIDVSHAISLAKTFNEGVRR